MIIWGSKGRDRTVDRGEFLCPVCRGQRPYDLHRMQRWFTLYFIPTFPLQTLGEYVHCRGCGGQFDAAILRVAPEELLAATQPWRCACGNANPPGVDQCLACGQTREAQLAVPQPAGEQLQA